MSHFTVLVIGEDHEGQLAPYNENIQVDGYKEHYDERSIERYKEMWKRRDEEHDAPLGLVEVLEGKEPLPPLSVDQIEDPSIEELIAWMNEEWGDSEYGIDDDGPYRVSHYNPKSKWDWYEVGGRWRGYFKLKIEAMDAVETLAVVGRTGSFDNEQRYDADHTLKKYIDIEGMRDIAGKEAGERWDMAERVLGNLPPALSWLQMMAKHTPEGSDRPDIEAARKEYHEQPRVARANEHDHKRRGEDRWKDCLLGFNDDVTQYQVTREAFVQDARDRAISTYAYVRDGEWFAPGTMGWWGLSDDGEKDKRRYVKEFNEMLDALPDDTMLTIVDCHI